VTQVTRAIQYRIESVRVLQGLNLSFDAVAERFALEIDRAILQNGYARGRVILELAQRAIPPGHSVLDFGCGPGRLSLLLARAGFRVRGVDISEGMLAQARTLDRRGLNLEFEIIKEHEEILQPDSCDAIVCSSVIEYVVDPDELLRQFHAALRKSGVLIVSYANKSSLWRKSWDRRANPLFVPHHHVWHWRGSRGFRALLGRHGFRTVDGPTFFESPFDLRPWGRWLRRVSLVGSLGVVTARPDRSPPDLA